LERSKLDLKAIQNKLEQSENQYKNLISACGTDESSLISLTNNYKAMESMLDGLKEQNKSLQNELELSTEREKLANKSYEAVKEDNENLRKSFKSIATGHELETETHNQKIAPIEYNGKCKIVSVFGSGSFGITTTAMSLALRLMEQFNVLYIDFDLVSPKADGWFGCINPMVDISDGQRVSGIELLINSNTDIFMQNAMTIIRTYKQTKGGKLDYLSGIYQKFDKNKIGKVDFTKFFNFCATMYKYIIVDFGRFGSSDTNNELIKAISDISYKNIIVTTNDKYDAKTLRIKLDESEIDLNKCIWLLNLCDSTNIENTTAKAIIPAKRVLMPYENSISRQKKDFTMHKLTKGKFEILIEEFNRTM
jgi:MinD-like ATPase involved in chromosome partitioning or flagellar assembly